MANLDEISRAIGGLEAKAESVERMVSDLTSEIRREREALHTRVDTVERWQGARDAERRRDRLWLTLGGGLAGSIMTYIAPGLARKLGLN